MQTYQSQRQESGYQVPEIIVYPQRRRLKVLVLVSTVCAVFLFLFSAFTLILMISGTASHQLGASLTLLSMEIMGMAGSIWLTRILASFLSSGEPMLAINQGGIRVGKLYGPTEIFLPWTEIEAIFIPGGAIGKQLAIRPAEVRRFLSQFGLFMRFFLWVNLLSRAPIIISQAFLEKPIDEILRQLQTLYTPELRYYGIQIRPPLR